MKYVSSVVSGVEHNGIIYFDLWPQGQVTKSHYGIEMTKFFIFQ